MAIPMPGPYGVSQTIQDILTRRREDSRQAMLDKLQEERVRAEMDVQQKQLTQGDRQIELEGLRTAATQAQTAQQIAESKHQMLGRDVDRQPHTPTRLDTMGDDLRQELMRLNQAEEIQPFGPTEDGGTPSPFMVSRGSPKYQEEQATLDRYQRLPDNPTARDFLAAGLQPSERMLAGNRKVYLEPWNATGTKEIGPYDEVDRANQPYQMPTWNAPKEYQELDPAGRPVRTHFLTPEQGRPLVEELAKKGHTLVESTTPFSADANNDRAKGLADRELSDAFRVTNRTQRAQAVNQSRTNRIAAAAIADPQITRELNYITEDLVAFAEESGPVAYNSAEIAFNALKSRFPQMSPQDEAEVVAALNSIVSNMPKAPRPAPTAGAAPISSNPNSPGNRR